MLASHKRASRPDKISCKAGMRNCNACVSSRRNDNFTKRSVDLAVAQLARPILDRSEGLQTALGQLWQQFQLQKPQGPFNKHSSQASGGRAKTTNMQFAWVFTSQNCPRARTPLCFTTSWEGGSRPPTWPCGGSICTTRPLLQSSLAGALPEPLRTPNLALLGPQRAPSGPKIAPARPRTDLADQLRSQT